ncbi:conserved membrane hypothetical protein [Planktothrix sp. PCC 11201]|uniref:DUF6629 family protein n=1 Tax=Planktothrix sp. PCC 11201 TaxID=1729650 RepID=UPI000921D788|nr:DUF6629 family protein [Planktothrix sp. PCC 11201]SKB12862.1 conserved membrane hypothetical protein [Planktothrix sp. PCC 11201]
MCFSATASFTASLSLSVLGIATLKQTTSKKQLLLATFPLLFATQQFFEGVVWLNLEDKSSPIYFIGIYVFLVFATGFWLIFCPISVYLLEDHPLRKKTILGIAVIGAILGIYLVSCVVRQEVMATNNLGNLFYNLNLLYDFKFAFFYDICKYLYLLVISVPFLISSQRLLAVFGILIIFSFILADRFYQATFISVWCFFAAVISSVLLFIFFDWKTALSRN